MAKKRQATPPGPLVTSERATRLCRLVTLLQSGPQTRAHLLRRLKLDIRGFYRDLQLLRSVGITVTLEPAGYTLSDAGSSALARLPFPDPHLTLADVQQLSKGKSAAHQKLKTLLQQLLPAQ